LPHLQPTHRPARYPLRGLRDPGSGHRYALALLRELRRVGIGPTWPLVQVPQLPRHGTAEVAAMMLGEELHTDLAGIIGEATEKLRQEEQQRLFSRSERLDRRCPTCDGNGVHPELLDENGDAAHRMVDGRPYFFCVKCETCSGSGEIGRWPSESAAPDTQGDQSPGRTGQRGGHFFGGGA